MRHVNASSAALLAIGRLHRHNCGMISSELLPKISGYIGGAWHAAGGATIQVINPATGEPLADIPDMGAQQTAAAIDAASASLQRDHPIAERAGWLSRLHELMMHHQQELARIITLEQGKPLKEAMAEVEYSAGFFRFFSEQLTHLESENLPQPIRNLRWTIHHRPAGVVGLITPWNFPLGMLAKKLSAALGAGCAIVTKPSELTPLSAIAFWTLAESAKIPAGRLNLVLGRPEPIGDTLCEHPAVRLISFTGSTAVGKLLAAKCAPHVKRLALELGGNAAVHRLFRRRHPRRRDGVDGQQVSLRRTDLRMRQSNLRAARRRRGVSCRSIESDLGVERREWPGRQDRHRPAHQSRGV